MVITLDAKLEAVLIAIAHQKGLAPEELALKVLRERLIVSASLLEPRDE